MKVGEFSRRVLVVDDESVVRTGIAQALERLGFEVRLAATGAEGMRLMAAWPAAIVLLDVRLPDLDGLQVLQRLTQDHPETVVIMITGYPTIEDAVASIKQGALDYLVKPFHLEHLEALVAKAQETMHHRVAAQPCRRFLPKSSGPRPATARCS
jgi:DNA-binding NtrC family response regulator